VEYFYGFDKGEEREIEDTVKEKQQQYLRKWYELKKQNK
jgi:hypothetical protein